MMHPKRKFRLIAIPVCMLAIFVCSVMIAQWIPKYEKKYARMGETTDNQTVGKMIISQLIGCYFVTGPNPTRSEFYTFIQPEVLRENKPYIPRLTTPFSLFTHFVYGYQLHGKLIYQSPTLSHDLIPSQLLDLSLVDKSSKYKVPYNTRMDEKWEIRTAKLQSHDTVYFHSVLTNVDGVYRNLPALIDSALAQYPYVFHVPSTDPKQQFKDRYDESRVVIFDGNRVLYQRGDTTNCSRLWAFADSTSSPLQLWLPGHQIRFVVYRSNNIDWPKLMFAHTNRILLEITISFLFLLFAAWEIGYYRGYSILPKQRAKEMEWERDHNMKNG